MMRELVMSRWIVTVCAIAVGTWCQAGCRGTPTSSSSGNGPALTVSIDVIPATLALTVGQTVQLTGIARDSSGNALADRAIAWASSDTAVATVNGSGLVHAVGAGSVDITASNGGKTGSATATVTGGGIPPAVLFQDGFEGSDSLGSFKGPTDVRWGDRYEYQPGAVTVVTAASQGITAHGGTRVLKIGGVGGGSLSHWLKDALGSATPLAREHVYLTYWIYIPSAWTADLKMGIVRGSATQWGSFGQAGSCPSAVAEEYFALNPFDRARNLHVYNYWLGMHKDQQSPPVCYGSFADTPQDVPNATYLDPGWTVPRDQWFQVGIEVQMNTPGLSDGWEKIYVDNVLKIAHENVKYRVDSATRIQAISFDTGNSPVGMNVYYDDIVVESAKP